MVNCKFSSPFGDRLRFPIMGQGHIVSFVLSLCYSVRPLTITWKVAFVIVFAINLMESRWTFSHVGKEIRKAAPPLTNGDSSTAVVFPACGVWISAPLYHAGPHIICGTMPFAMPPTSGSRFFIIKAPAAFHITTAKTCDGSANYVSTVASACPEYLEPIRVANFVMRQSNKSIESFSRNVNELSHVRIVIPVLCVVNAGTNHQLAYTGISYS